VFLSWTPILSRLEHTFISNFVLEPTASSLKGLSGVPLLKKGWGFNSRNFLARGEDGSKYTLPIQLPGPAKQRTRDLNWKRAKTRLDSDDGEAELFERSVFI
jgi:hypothetical protein